jgi:homeodomain-containing protein
MSKHQAIYLTDDQRTILNSLIRSGSAPARTHPRARILLLLDHNQAEPFTDEAIAKALRCHCNTVGNVRRRFVTAGLQAALSHKPLPPRAPKKLTGEVEAHLSALACSAPPAGRRRWTLRLLADRLVALGLVEHISHVAVGACLKKTFSNHGKSSRGASPEHRPRSSPRWTTSEPSISGPMILHARRSAWMKHARNSIARPKAPARLNLGDQRAKTMSTSVMERRASLSGWSPSRGGGKCA